MARVVENVRQVALLDDLPCVHDHDAVGHVRYNSEVVCNEEDPDAHFLSQYFDLGQDLSLGGYVQGCGRFVGNEYFRRTRQGHCDHDALAHTTRELMWVRAGPLSRPGYTNPVQQVDGPQQGRSPAYRLVCSELLDDLVPHPLHRV